MNNLKALKTEKSIDRVVNKIYTAKNNRRYDLVRNYKKILVALIHKWEVIKGDTVDNNAVMGRTIINKTRGLRND